MIWFLIYSSCMLFRLFIVSVIYWFNQYGNYIDLEWAIGINRISLKILGLWPDDKLNRRQKFLADLRALFIFFTMLCVSVIPGLLALLRVWGDIVAMSDNMQIGLPFLVTAMKFIIMWFHKKGKFLYFIIFYLHLEASVLPILLHPSLKILNQS